MHAFPTVCLSTSREKRMVVAKNPLSLASQVTANIVFLVGDLIPSIKRAIGLVLLWTVLKITIKSHGQMLRA